MDYQGKVDGVCVIGREVTQRFFPLIFDSISHAIFTTDAGGTITSFNRAAEEIDRLSTRRGDRQGLLGDLPVRQV